MAILYDILSSLKWLSRSFPHISAFADQALPSPAMTKIATEVGTKERMKKDNILCGQPSPEDPWFPEQPVSW